MKASLTDCREVDMQKRLGPFMITGLPRSRTAWLANLFTTDTTICFHDQPFSLETVDSGKVVGFSGTELCLQFDEVSRFYPGAPWLIVLREQSEAREAFQKILRTKSVMDDKWQARCHLISSLCAKWQTMTVNFDELDSESVVRGVWAHLLPGIPFDVERFHLLSGMRVVQKALPQ